MTRPTHVRQIPVLYELELPSYLQRVYHYDGGGYSIYKGVLVLWDEDYDDRIFDFIDSLPPCDAANLLVAEERKARLTMAWLEEIPPKFVIVEGVEVGMDYWNCWAEAIDGEAGLDFRTQLFIMAAAR